MLPLTGAIDITAERTRLAKERDKTAGEARKLVQTKRLDVENSLRGILRGFGLKVGKVTPRGFAGRNSYRGSVPQAGRRPRSPWE